MKIKDEKNQMNQTSKRLIIIGGALLLVIVLTTVLFNSFNNTSETTAGAEYQPPVRTGEPGFIDRSATNQLTQPQPEEGFDIDSLPGQSIFDRPRAQQNTQPQQPRQPSEEEQRRKELYEEALASQVKIGDEVLVSNNPVPSSNSNDFGQSGQVSQRQEQKQQNMPLQYQQASEQRETVDFTSPLTPFTILEGTMIEATLQTSLSSALPGNIIGVINRDIFDSINQEYLLIPRGTRVIGTYESSIAFDQRKLMMSWDRLLFPDGRSIDLPAVPTHDLSGMSGLGGEVNTHFWSIFGQSAMLSLIGAGASVAISPQQSGAFQSRDARETIAMQVAQDFQRVANTVFRRNLNRQPTIEIEAGEPFLIYILDDMAFEEPYRYTEVGYNYNY